MAALPDVFWSPAVFTPGKLMFAEPSKETPPIVLAVAKAVAVAALEFEETYVAISDTRACFITSPSDITIPSVPTNVTVA